MSRPRQRLALTLAIGGSLLFAACKDSDTAGPPSSAPPSTSTENLPKPSSTRQRSTAENLPLIPWAQPRPDVGTAIFRFEDDQLSVSANAAPRLPLVEDLAEAMDFELQTSGYDWPALTVEFEDLTVEEALPLLVGELSYRPVWVNDEAGGAHRLVSLAVGDPSHSVPSSSDEDEEHDPRLVSSELEESSFDSAFDSGMELGEVVAQVIQESQSQDSWEIDSEQLLDWADDPDPRLRMRAAIDLEPEGEGLNRLVRLLGSDPDPRVRAAATASLENGESYAAVEALVLALGDPDPEVVVEVIESLEFAGDESNVAHLQPLLRHPHPNVREAAEEAIDFLAE